MSPERPVGEPPDRSAAAPDESSGAEEAGPADATPTADREPTDQQAAAAGAGTADPAGAPRAALARARQVARDRGLRPGQRPIGRRRMLDPTLSGPDQDGRDPALIGDQMARLLSERGWQADVAVGSLVGRWPSIVGPQVADHVRPVSYDAGVLTVQADSTAWATQMGLLTSKLLGRLEDEVGPGTVTELVVRGPAAPRWSHGPRRVAGRGPRDTYG